MCWKDNYQWSALRPYFSSHEDVDKPGHMMRIASNLQSAESLLYIHYILGPLNKCNTTFQSAASNRLTLHDEMLQLLKSVLSRFVRTTIVVSSESLMDVPYDFPDKPTCLEAGMQAIGILFVNAVVKCL